MIEYIARQIPTVSGREVGVHSETQNGVAGTAVELVFA
jgi:hypothetical protein